ncbi:conjugal transfer protein TrbI, partial [Burkholderia sp. SIMBA_042]
QTIRDQAEKARAEAERQRRVAIPPDTTKTPLLTASDLASGAKGGAAPDGKKNERDTIFTAPIYKSGVRKSQLEGKGAAGVSDVTDPAQ